MDDRELVTVLAALATETRLRLLRHLHAGALHCRVGAGCDLSAHCCNVGELARAVGVSAPTVSHHLKELRQAGLIRMERRGQFMQVTLQPERLRELAAACGDFLRHGAPASGAQP